MINKIIFNLILKGGKVMSTLKVRVMQKLKDGNKIIGYVIQDASGAQMQVEASKFKAILRSGQAECINMTLTSDNRLVEHKIQMQKQAVPARQGIQNVATARVPKEQTKVKNGIEPVQTNVKQNTNEGLPDNAYIRTRDFSQLISMCKEEDTVSFMTGSSQPRSVDDIIKKAIMMNRVISKVNDRVYFIDFGNNKKIVVAKAKTLNLVDNESNECNA